MNPIVYKKMSLFDAPEGSIIIHACNRRGMWGSGIAKTFAEKYPESYEDYKFSCSSSFRKTAGWAEVNVVRYENERHKVGWLVTSDNYGQLKDSREVIKINTALAIQSLFNYIESSREFGTGLVVIYSNKFNSGLFDVPWKETELILSVCLKMFPRIKWVVCDPNMEDV